MQRVDCLRTNATKTIFSIFVVQTIKEIVIKTLNIDDLSESPPEFSFYKQILKKHPSARATCSRKPNTCPWL